MILFRFVLCRECDRLIKNIGRFMHADTWLLATDGVGFCREDVVASAIMVLSVM